MTRGGALPPTEEAMMTRTVIAWWRVLPLGVALAACGRTEPPLAERPGAPAGEVLEATSLEAVDSSALASARSAADALGQGLMTALLGQLAAAGPEGALAFCADSAQRLTARYQGEGVDVHRTSLKVRNPANAPDSVEVRVLDLLADLHESGVLPPEYVEVRRLATGTRELRYFRPIRVAAGCLTCHGPANDIAPSIQAVLAERYPEDMAVGYAEGDLRGVIAVRRRLPE
jgi:hypothetical protein